MTRDLAATYPERFAVRVLQDAFTSAHRACLLRRAEQIEASRPRPGDFTGRATREDLARRGRELTEIASALRNAAAFVERYPVVTEAEIATALREAA